MKNEICTICGKNDPGLRQVEKNGSFALEKKLKF
jgi:hypothetical protein